MKNLREVDTCDSCAHCLRFNELTNPLSPSPFVAQRCNAYRLKSRGRNKEK